MADERSFQSAPGMVPLFARAGVGLIPGASRLPFLGGRRANEVPDRVLVLNDVSVSREKLAAYQKVCGFSLSDTLPPTYPHIVAFPLHLSLMTDPSFPFPAIGLVHIGNEIIQHRPISAAEELSVRVWPTPLEPHPRGRQFSLRTEVSVAGQVVWEETSTNLRRGGGGDDASGSDRHAAGPERRAPDAEELPAVATWRLPGDLGRRYAAVSGDINPIHMHALSARLFGFPSAIAHGMWTKARCLAALENRLPESFTVEVAFRRAILLPATVQFAEVAGGGTAGGGAEAAGDGGTVRFAVRDARKGTPHLAGLLRR